MQSQGQINCNPQSQNCNTPNRQHVSSTVIRTQQGVQANKNIFTHGTNAQGSVSGSTYGYQGGNGVYTQVSSCNPQIENCVSVNTNQGIIYIPSTGISQSSIQNTRCNPSTQNCGAQSSGKTGTGGFLIISQPKCEGSQNCGSQTRTTNIQSTGFNQQSSGTQNVGSIPVYVPYVEPSRGTLNPHTAHSFSQNQGHGHNTVGHGSFDQHTSQFGSASQYGNVGEHIGTTSQSSGHHYGTTGQGLGQFGTATQTWGHGQSSTGQTSGRSFITTKTGQPKCPEGFQGITRHPTDCKKFLNCANGQTFVQDCAPGTLFNPKNGICDFPYNVNCDATVSATTESSWQRTSYGKLEM